MKTLRAVGWIAWLVLLTGGRTLAADLDPAREPGPSDVLRFHHENVLGTSMELKVVGVGLPEANHVEEIVLGEIDRLAAILSTYAPESEASRWLRTSGTSVAVSRELFEVLDAFDRWRLLTGGALEASAETACRLWRSGASSGRVPGDDALAEAVRAMSGVHWRLDPVAGTAARLSDAPIRLNSLAKGYVIERAVAAARRVAPGAGIVLNIGGDLVVRGPVPETVLIVDPRDDAEGAAPVDRVRVLDRAVATSGTYKRGVEIDGRWYSHIVDPRTARPVDAVASATVIAPTAVDAGALATAFCVMTPAASLRLARSMPDVECLLVAKDGRRWSSEGWSRWQVSERSRSENATGLVFAAVPSSPDAAGKPGAPTWNPEFELRIQFELARFEDPRYRRPFVAVWVEDKDKVPVRTVALWFQGPRWLPDLRSWYRGDQLRQLADPTDLAASVASATRPPGRYTVKWDGKDDAGAWVKPGKYTVFLEAAREHGTYQLIRKEMEFPAKLGRIELQGNAEVTSASLEYRRKTEAK